MNPLRTYQIWFTYRPGSYRAENSLLSHKTNQLMLYRTKVAVFSEIHTKHINTLLEQKVDLFCVKPDDTQYKR
jgi:hypothetical protein